MFAVMQKGDEGFEDEVFDFYPTKEEAEDAVKKLNKVEDGHKYSVSTVKLEFGNVEAPGSTSDS